MVDKRLKLDTNQGINKKQNVIDARVAWYKKHEEVKK